MSAPQNQQKTKERPTVVAKPQEEQCLDDIQLDDFEDGDNYQYNQFEMGAQMVEQVLGRYFEYADESGTPVNVVDALLLVRNSIDKQSKCILKLVQVVEAMQPKAASSNSASTSSAVRKN